MSEYTETQIEEMVQEAVEKTEKSFGGTFKRLKSENEELMALRERSREEHNAAKAAMENQIAELESMVSQSKSRISELAVKSELQKQLREKGALPERYIDMAAIEYSDNPEILAQSITEVLEKGRSEFQQSLSELGITVAAPESPFINPTNPPSRDTKTSQDMKRAGAREVLGEMSRRGLLARQALA